jgi:hypothetical protein
VSGKVKGLCGGGGCVDEVRGSGDEVFGLVGT